MFKNEIYYKWICNNFIYNQINNNNFTNKKYKKNIWVLITPWLNTSVPFFSIQIANCLEKKGHQVSYLFDLQKGFDNYQANEEIRPIVKIKYFLKILGKRVYSLCKSKKHKHKFTSNKTAKKLLFENLVKQNNSEEFALKNGYPKINPIAIKIEKVKELIITQKIGEFLIPGGIYGWSGAYITACKELNIPFWTYDSGNNLLTISRNCIASHFDEFAQGLTKIKLPSYLLKKIKEFVVHAHKNKTAGKDINAYMKNAKISKNDRYNSDGLILLNYRCDTAAMLRSNCFENVQDWIYCTAKWFIKNQRKLIIRRHPCENNPNCRSSDSYNFIKKIDSKYIYFIDFDEHINTYVLINKTKVVLPFTSRIGLEALFLQKPVIIASKCYYEDVSSIEKAQSKKQYFDLLKKYTKKAHKIKVSPEILTSLFLAEECLFAESLITPMPEKFYQWATMNISSIEKDKGFSLLLKCISENKNFIHECFKEKISK